MTELIEYNNNKLKDIKISYMWIILIIFILSIIVFVFNKINYNEYYVFKGVLTDKNNINIMIKSNDLKLITTNNKIIINNKNFAYTIKNIKESVLIDGDLYNELNLYVELDNNQNIINNYFEIKLLINKKTILEYIKRKVMNNT